MHNFQNKQRGFTPPLRVVFFPRMIASASFLKFNATKRSSARAGFTLLEMIISIGIFSVLVVASIGIMLNISNAQLKAANVQITQDNIRFALELMTKEIRTGYAYAASHFCGAGAREEISFLNSASEKRVYYRSGDNIMRIAGSTDCGRSRPLMAAEVGVERTQFQIGGATPGDSDGQPWVLVSLSLRSKTEKRAFESHMDLETMVVQRFRDL